MMVSKWDKPAGLAFVLVLIFSIQSTAQLKLYPQLGTAPVREVIKAMTLEEKAHLVVGADLSFSRGYPSMFGGPDTLYGKVSSVVGYTPQIVPGAAGTTYPISRLGIPPIVMADGPAGLRISPTRQSTNKTFFATAFPAATLLACSWDTSLVRSVGEAMGKEVLEYGVDILLAPALNIHRNPLGGRNFEYYSEDPLLSGQMASAIVRGVQANGVGTSIKHYAANNSETNRMFINTVVSERALREIYLKGFEISVKADPWTVMSSYNQINGIFAPERRDLLSDVLRDEFGFNGFVMTDWCAGRDPLAQVQAGNDLLMPGSTYIIKQIIDAVESGKLPEEYLDKNVEAILKIVMKTPRFKGYKYSNSPDLAEHARMARRSAAEGMVLLKNARHTLPFSKTITNVAAFGNGSYQLVSGGTGSGDVNKAYSISFSEGLTKAGYRADEELGNIYAKYLKHAKDTLWRPGNYMDRPHTISELALDRQLIERKALESDVAVITISRISGEVHDRLLDGDFYLTKDEKLLISNVSDAFHSRGKKLIVLLNVGGVIETASWRNQADAILLAWLPGQEGGNAIVDILSGKVNPSGKLSSTFPIVYEHVSSAKNFPTSLEAPTVRYEEGIYVGYRYFDSFDIKPAFEFGYGLSFTKFKYSNLKLSGENTANGSVRVSLTVRNTRKVPGKEIVQLYLKAPSRNLDKPEKELKGFIKTALLQPGKSETLVFTLLPEDLASFDTETSSWIAEKGRYFIQIGSSSQKIKCQTRFTLPNSITVKKVKKALALQEPLLELKQ